ncbi:exo-alpha-sialidase [Streptomyces sp. RerS4]|uniref:exo-alpha-sialidase n=1 Tax=Streptomyces sp. RerS4 TaxID=2942449 RepID=UPI00201C1AE0|nr:exo-alpha-sialidase [Streptomyces sp. RerS4]UQX04711.1 exo-alpha-sialidase [Streptomyces sp. RerS4]
MDAPTAKAIERAKEAAEELGASGTAVSVRLLGWGFALRLDQRACDHFTEPDRIEPVEGFRSLVSEVLAGSLPADTAEAVDAALTGRAEQIRSAAQGAGCELHSPWSAPTLLASMALDATPCETGLWFSVFTPGAGWGADTQFTTHYASETPALAVFGDDLYCVYQGRGDNPGLWWTVHRGDGSWSEDQTFPAHHTLGSPALAVFQDRLYCAHRGGTGDWGIAVTSYDGDTWTPDQPVPHAESVYGPALAVFRDALHLAYADAAQRIMVTTSLDGRNWTAPEPVPGCATTRSPALAVYDGTLHLLHGNPKDGAIHWSQLRDTGWIAEGALPGHRTRSNIGLAVLDGKLMCVHRDPARQQLWWSAFDGAGWSTDTEMPGHSSKYGPALAVYQGPASTRGQLLCVHRGHAQRLVTAAGEVLTDENPAGLHELDDPGYAAD